MTNKDSEKKANEIINSYYSSFNSNKAKENLNTAELSQEDIEICKKVIPPAQFKFTMKTMELTESEKGEKSEFFRNMLKEIADTYRRINTDSELTNEDGTHTVGFRYFLGDTEIFLSKIDSDGIGFGYNILNGDLQMSEWGYTSLEEIMKIPYIEMDYHVPEGMTIERMLYQEHPEYFSEYAPKEDLLNVINFSNWTYYNSDKISTKVYDVEISASLYEQLLPSEYEERSIKEDEVVCIQYRKSVLSEEQDQFLIEKFNKNNFMLLQQKEIQIDVKLKNKIKNICNSYIEPQNNNSYTNEILDKIRAAGIEVVTDKEEFDRILLQEERLQKMTGKSPKWLTVDDVKFLSELGYKKFDEIVQIQNAILLSNYELNDKKISVNKAIEILGREEFLGSVSRSAFHWTSGNSKNGNHVHFDSSILFSRDKEYYQNREKLEQSNKESKEHIGILNDILTKESYFTFNSEDSRKFVEQVNEWEKDNSNPRKLIIVGNISPVMKVLGITDRLIEVEHSTLDKMIRNYPLYPDDKQGHQLNIESIYSIPSQLANPVMVFKSKTRDDSYVFFTERKDSKNRSILIPLAADKRKGRIVINEITSMYGKDNEINFVKSNFDEDKLLYIDKERAEQWNKEWALKTKSFGGELESKVQFLGQRITDIETYTPSILTKERLVNFISGNDKSEYLQKMITDENIYGFVYNSKIYLNPKLMNSNAAVHEYTHLWDAYAQKTNPELWNKGLEIFKDTKYWNEVISDPNYQDINDDENLVLSEIHSRICGDIAEKVLNRIAELDGEQVKLDAIDWNKETAGYVLELIKDLNPENSFIQQMKEENIKEDVLAFFNTPMKDLINEKNISIELSWKNIKNDFNDIDFETAYDRAIEILTENGKEKDEFMLKQETVWQLLDSGYLDVHFDINSADIDRGWYSDTLDSLSEKYVNGIIRFDEIQNIYNIEESEYFKEQNIPTINEYKPLDYNNPDDVKSFAAFLNNNFVLSGKDIFTPEIAKFILQYDANIDDKPDQLTLINNEIYCHPLNGNMNNPQKETPDTWKIYGSDKDTVLEIIGRTLDLADESTLSKNDLLIKSQLNSIYEEINNDLNKALLNSSNSIIESYLKKVKQNLKEKDKYSEIRKVLRKELFNEMKSEKNPLLAIKNIYDRWKKDFPDKCCSMIEYLKARNCRNKKGYKRFFMTEYNIDINRFLKKTEQNAVKDIHIER